METTNEGRINTKEENRLVLRRMLIGLGENRGYEREKEIEDVLCYHFTEAKTDYRRQYPCHPGYADIITKPSPYWCDEPTLIEIKYEPMREEFLKSIGQCFDYKSRLKLDHVYCVFELGHFSRKEWKEWQRTACEAGIYLLTTDQMIARIYKMAYYEMSPDPDHVPFTDLFVTQPLLHN